MTDERPFPPIGDYGLLSDCHTAALVSRAGSIDWCCFPRFDSPSTFGRLLDAEHGGCCAVAPVAEHATERRYVDETLVLETTFRTEDGVARLTDCLIAPPAEGRVVERRLLRVVDGVSGEVDLDVLVRPRFDFGDVAPWFRRRGDGLFSASGGDDGLLIWCDEELEAGEGDDELACRIRARGGQRTRLLVRFTRPERLDDGADAPDPDELDAALDETIRWWKDWSDEVAVPRGRAEGARRSALVLKGLSYAPTGAITAAATTSLPETPGGSRNWDYRYAWLRDSVLSSRALADLGVTAPADGFRRFVERSAAGRAADLRVVYGIGGERRLAEQTAEGLDGYRGARPVRVGNGAAGQSQHDAYGHLLMQSWNWHLRGHSPEAVYWTFLVRLVEHVVEHWREPDAGIWEWRGDLRHFVHSKAMCWAALDLGLRLAEDLDRDVPAQRWREEADAIRDAVLDEGFDEERGTFVQAFGSDDLDAAVLRLPVTGIVDWSDERMVSTADVVARELGAGAGLVRRYLVQDGTGEGPEGAFLACSFWLAELLARQGRRDEARRCFEQSAATANDLGLFSEEYDTDAGEMLGNFPQALTHLSHVDAALALEGGR